jgi:hypothetical protein
MEIINKEKMEEMLNSMTKEELIETHLTNIFIINNLMINDLALIKEINRLNEKLKEEKQKNGIHKTNTNTKQRRKQKTSI